MLIVLFITQHSPLIFESSAELLRAHVPLAVLLLPHGFVIFNGFLATPRVVSIWLVAWLISYTVVYTLRKAPCSSIPEVPVSRSGVFPPPQCLSTKPRSP